LIESLEAMTEVEREENVMIGGDFNLRLGKKGVGETDRQPG